MISVTSGIFCSCNNNKKEKTPLELEQELSRANKEIERLNNIINELEKMLKDDTINVYCCTRSSQKTMKSALNVSKIILLNKLQELKENNE